MEEVFRFMEERNMIYAEVLSKLIQAETISELGQTDKSKFLAFHELLKETFPNIFGQGEFEEHDGSFILKWAGKDSSKEPVLLMNHHDVVEASGQWEHEPFSGAIADGKVWGRGTLDTKGGLWAMLQAADELAKEGVVPNRDIYFLSTCTEETDGAGGAALAQLLKDRGLHFYMVLDEGGMILYDPIGGADGTFAMAGVGEKGCADIKFIARSGGGHASMPGKNTPIARLSQFVAEVEKSNIFDTQVSPTIREMLKRFSPTMKGVLKLACGNAGLFSKVLCMVMPAISPAAGAMLRTTVAFTMCKGSDGTNVLPQEAWVIGNMRYSHHEGRDHSIKVISDLAKKYDLEVEVMDKGIESGLTDYNAEPFKFIEKAVSEIFPGVATVPYIMAGASDSRYFSIVSDNCIRFLPFRITDEQLDSIHGLNENVDVAVLAEAVDFYRYVLTEV